jgi:HSP20 family protein
MADLLTRPNGHGRSLVNDLFGFEPVRGVFGAPSYAGEVRKTESGWSVELPVPGYKPEQIEVTVEDRVLTVNGTTERRSFQRSIVLPKDIDVDAIDAHVEHGMLTLGLQLHAKAQPRKIEIKTVN